VCILSLDGRIEREIVVGHSGAALEGFFNELGKLARAGPQAVAVAIETPRGAMVEGLIEKGLAVFSINPKQLDRFRDRHTVAGAKDDRRDAYVLADSLRSDRHLFRRLKIDDPVVIELREHSRFRDDLVEELGRASNQLRQQLHRYFPQVLELSPAANDAWVWALLKAAPTPESVQRLSPHRLQKILKTFHVRRFDSLKVAQLLSTTPLPVAPGVAAAASAHVRFLLPRLELLREQLKQCDKRLDELLDIMKADTEIEEHRGAKILLSLPGIGRSVAATMLAEAPQAVAKADYAILRSLCGAAPVTKRSGKGHYVLMRRACNHRLRNAVYHMARGYMQKDPAGRERYLALRARGLSHARALRTLADRLLRVLAAMLRNSVTYQAAAVASTFTP
jgi:transposase